MLSASQMARQNKPFGRINTGAVKVTALRTIREPALTCRPVGVWVVLSRWTAVRR